LEAFNGVMHSLSAQIGLSLAGACPYYPEGVDGPDPREIGAENLAGHVVMNAMLTFETTARRKYEADYNLSQMIRKVESQSRRGGFFSTEAVNSVVNNGLSDDWFRIRFEETSSDFAYTPEEKTKITNEVKQGLMQRALKNFATLTGVNATAPAVPELIKPGTRKVARKIRSCFWWGCRSSWIIATVADSAARQTAISNFHQNNSVWSREIVDQQAVIPRTAIVSFDPGMVDDGPEYE